LAVSMKKNAPSTEGVAYAVVHFSSKYELI